MLTTPAKVPGPKTINMLHAKHGLLQVKAFAGFDQYGGALWHCLCDCGRDHICLGTKLRYGTTSSCGCIRSESARAKGRARTLPDGEAALRQRYYQYKKVARGKGLVFDLDRKAFDVLLMGCCFYCGSKPFRKSQRSFFNGIDRVDNSSGYVDGNVVSACYMCNRAKANVTKAAFIEWITKVHENLAKKFE